MVRFGAAAVLSSRGTGSPLYGGWATEKASHSATVLMAARWLAASADEVSGPATRRVPLCIW